MSKAKISKKIAQAIKKANSACIYSNICKCISKVLCELRDYVWDFPSDGHSEELGTILFQLTNLCKILDSFKHDNLLKASLQFAVEDLLTNLKEIMELVTTTLEKIDVKLVSKYDPSIDNIYNDLSNLYGKLSDKNQPEIKKKLDEINQYVDKIGKPLLVSIQKNQTTKKSESSDDIYIPDSSESSDNDNDDNNKEENMLNEIDERFDFKNVDKYHIQKSDYTQGPIPIFKNSYYSIYKGKMKLSKEKVLVMVLNKRNFSEEKFKRFINVLTALKHPNLESFVGYVESPLPHTVVTRLKGEKLTTILRRENGEEIESESEDENDTEDDENTNDNDENASDNNENANNNDENASDNNENANNNNENANNNDENASDNNENANNNNENASDNNENANNNNENASDNDENDEIESKLAKEEISLKPGYRTIIAFQIASTMSYLHSMKIAHRDLCTENITIDENLNPRITNFAASRVIPDNILCMSNVPNLTTKFVAPEIKKIEGYNQEVDVFAFGGILYELLMNKRPFFDKINPFDEISKGKRPELPENISPELKELIESCWKQESNERPIFANIVQQMLDNSISFPQDQDSEVLKQFYASKKIKNVELKTCFNLLKNIQEDKDIYVYKEEVNRIRLFLQKYQHVLQSSEYAKQESIKNGEANIQINNMNVALNNLWSTINQIGEDSCLPTLLCCPLLEVPNDFKRFMEEIYICLTSMSFKVPKYEQNDSDLKWDFRYIYYTLKEIINCEDCEDCEDIESLRECQKYARVRIKEIEDFMKKKKFNLTASPSEITESIKGLLSNWKNYEFEQSDFEVDLKPFSKGGSGIVFRGTQKSTGQKVAVKKMQIKGLIEKDQFKLLKREIATLVQLNNEYLIHFIGYVNEPGECFWIITDIIEGGDLWDVNSDPKIAKKEKLTPFQKTKIAFEIAQGMEYLQSKGIIHRDLKSMNILLDRGVDSKDIKVKICDFGLARIDATANTTKIGTPNYMAPEVINGECYDFKADVFSYGMVLWELYADEMPFSECNKIEIYHMIQTKTENLLDYPEDKSILPDLKELIEDATNYEPSKRPSFTDIINRMLDNKIAFAGANPDDITSFYEQKAQERNPS